MFLQNITAAGVSDRCLYPGMAFYLERNQMRNDANRTSSVGSRTRWGTKFKSGVHELGYTWIQQGALRGPSLGLTKRTVKWVLLI